MTDSRTRLAARTGDQGGYLRELLRSQDRACGECHGGALWPHSVMALASGTARQDPPCPSCAGTGLVLRPLVELMAWCLDPAAWRALDYFADSDHIVGICPCPECVLDSARDGHGLTGWLSGLSRWGPSVMVRAAVAAARVAYTEWLAERGWWLAGRVAGDTQGGGLVHTSGREQPEDAWREAQAPLLAVEAAEAYVNCPCDDHYGACRALVLESIDGPERLSEPFLRLLEVVNSGHLGVVSVSRFVVELVEAFSRACGEPAVRSAIQSALVSWAKGRLGL